MHVKNNNALLNYKNINFYIINHTNIDSLDLTQFECVYSPSQPLDVKKYSNTKFIFGPHFSVFPEKHDMDLITDNKNVIYIQPSEWAKNVWLHNPICKDIRLESLPFGVDTNKFNQIKPINERNYTFVYFKRRHPSELILIQNFLQSHNINAKLFDYVHRYDENDFINYLHESRFGIWLDAHESQGFALEEALSCNVPLLVWNVASMKEEVGSNYENIPATTIPYWDERCGESFKNINELPDKFNKFMNDLNHYKPRDYILENLSIEKCNEKFIQLVNKI
jgi:glycosyltransferase involved in cell wall biosynthesis